MGKQMKLSQAIREGAKCRPMGMEDYFVAEGLQQEGICSCALGAAYEAVTGGVSDDHEYVSDVLQANFPWLFEGGWHTGPRAATYSIGNIVAYMNDSGLFTREEIADWLESIGL